MMVCHFPNRESKSWGSQWVNLSTFGSFSRRRHTSTAHSQRIPMVEDPQAAWLLLLMCASTRANFWLRGVDFDFR